MLAIVSNFCHFSRLHVFKILAKYVMRIGILSREATLPFTFLLPFSKGSTLKERICSLKSKFIPLRVDPNLDGFHHQATQTGSHKSCFPL